MEWGGIARAYDWQLPLERAAFAAALDLAEPRADDRWLDVGTGTGGLLRALAGRPAPPSDVTGVDSCSAMLMRAPRLRPGWALQQADARRLPFADNDFSVVTAAYLLHVVDPRSRAQIVAECRRVLRPGGRLVVITPSWPRSRLGRLLYRPLAATARSSAGPAAALRPLDPRPELERAMFTVTESRYVGRGYPSLCILATAQTRRQVHP